jgi:acyl dehydratase
MFTMAEAARVVTDWAGDPAAVLEYGVRFTKPVVVPNDDQGAEIEVTGKVAAKLDDNTVRVDLVVTSGGEKVLAMPRAVVRLA